MSSQFRLISYGLLLFLLFSVGLKSAETTRVTFISEKPVSLQTEIHFEMQQSFPGFSFSTKGEQTLNATCIIKHPQQSPLQFPPFNGIAAIKQIVISLEANDQKIHFDSNSRQEKAPFYLDRLAEILNQPMTFDVGKDGMLQFTSPAVFSLIDHIPLLEGLDIKNFISYLLKECFVLAGEDLSVGKTFTKIYEIPAFPKTMRYTISAIDDYHVYANFKGELEKNALSLTKTLEFQGEQVPVTIKLNGSVEGKGRWNRDHALLAEVEAHHTYTALLSAGSFQWMAHFDMVAKNRATPDK